MREKRPQPARTGGAESIDQQRPDRTSHLGPDPAPNPVGPAVTVAPRPTLAASIKPIPRVPVRDKLLWSLDDLAALLGLSRRMLERMLSAGRLVGPDIRCGRRCLWRPSTIHAWIEQQGGGAHGQAR
jgi:excisionase family DNA binding protein